MSPFHTVPVESMRMDDVVSFRTAGNPPYRQRAARLSRDGVYRYELTRMWDPFLPCFTFIGLNPSTADHEKDDATIRRVVGFARQEKCGSICMLNVCALRATKPKVLYAHRSPVGPHNMRILHDCTVDAPYVVCGWGVHGGSTFLRANTRGLVQCLLDAKVPLRVLELTQDGEPSHPLMLKKSLRPVPWKGYA